LVESPPWREGQTFLAADLFAGCHAGRVDECRRLVAPWQLPRFLEPFLSANSNRLMHRIVEFLLRESPRQTDSLDLEKEPGCRLLPGLAAGLHREGYFEVAYRLDLNYRKLFSSVGYDS